jgi:vacuolar-type H+-ATPase subunit I/STV1
LAEVITAYNKLIEDRRLRMHAVDDTGIDSITWIVILVGGGLTLIGSFFIHLPTLGGHLFMNSLFSILLGLMIFMLVAIDQPFRSELGITPIAYINTLAGLKDLDINNNLTIDASK